MSKKKSWKDPHAKREAEKYAKPVPSRELILSHLEKKDAPQSQEELVEAFKLQDEEEQEALRRRLIAMVRDGQLIKMRTGKFGVIDRLDLIRGHVQGHSDGFGYLIPEDGGEDLFLSPKQMRQVFDGDQVLGRVTHVDHRGRREGVIIRVLNRKHSQIVGRFCVESGVSFVLPDNKRITHNILIPPNAQMDAKPGDIVVADIITPPTLQNQAVGHISEVLGKHMAPGMETDMMIRAYALPHVWPETVEQEASHFPEYVLKEELENRKDLRHLPFVTIDGEDARDFDDAVYCEKGKTNWTLYVAIADVSHYVKPGSALDQEALTRGNSVYFPSRVIPMLPEALSNGLCSLNPHVDRLALVCEMKVSMDGELKKYQFYPAVIHSNARLTYNLVADILIKKNPTLREQYAQLAPHLDNLYELYQALHHYRCEVGALNFEMAEPKVIFDENKKIRALVPLTRNDAHRLIEECMLCANVAAAKFILKHKHPGIFRIHPGPKIDRLPDLLTFLNELGLGLGGGIQPSPKDYAKLLEKIQDRPDSHIIQMMLLRSLGQATYNTKNEGHFGLAFEAYTHFTSPIRRYPDLLVHRCIYAILNRQKASDTAKQTLEQAALHCSMTERRADEASRQVISWLKCEFMMDKVGQEFTGFITSITAFGLFVELHDAYVEGLVHISTLENDYYHFDAIRQRLIGQRTGKIYCIGDTVKILVARVDLDQRQIDFDIVMSQKKKTSKKKATSNPKKAKETQSKKNKKKDFSQKNAAGKKKSPKKKTEAKKTSKQKTNPKKVKTKG